jgi:hypothetical protein
MVAEGFPVALERLGKLGPRPNGWTFPIEDVYRNGDEKRKAAEDHRGPFERVLGANVLVDCPRMSSVTCSVMRLVPGTSVQLTWSGIHGSYTRKEVSSQSVAARRRCRVRTITGHHVIDCCHVDAILCPRVTSAWSFPVREVA